MLKKRVLLVGAAGFLGQACAREFNSLDGFVIITTDKCGNVDYRGDLSDKSFVDSLPDADIVINCAAVQYINKQPWFRRKWFNRNNVLTTRNIVDRYHSKRLIHVSTSMVYDQSLAGPFTERSSLRSQGLYSESKLDAEKIVHRVKNHAIVVPCIIGGAGRGGLFVSFVKSISAFKSVFLVGNSNLRTSMVHVSDVAGLCKILVQSNFVGRFNAAADDALTISQWADLIGERLKSGCPHKIHISLPLASILAKLSSWRFLAREQISMLNHSHVLTCTRSKEIGWSPKFNSADIVRDICDGIMK